MVHAEPVQRATERQRIRLASGVVWERLTTISEAETEFLYVTYEVGGGPGGFYTKADYAEIVRYAADRYVTIVPEIDMPGHTHAAIGCRHAGHMRPASVE